MLKRTRTANNQYQFADSILACSHSLEANVNEVRESNKMSNDSKFALAGREPLTRSMVTRSTAQDRLIYCKSFGLDDAVISYRWSRVRPTVDVECISSSTYFEFLQ